MNTNYDAIIIGTGQAGPALAGNLAKRGMQVAIIERDKFGGSCINVGCIPSKALIASAHAAHMARECASFGININGSINVDMKQVKARKDRIVAKYNTGIENWLKNIKNCTVYEGHAKFDSQHSIKINDEMITADKIYINVGARASAPPMEGLDQIHYLTNSSIMDLDHLPEHLIIVGGSYIGLEFAQMYRRFGSKVTIIERNSRLISREDTDVSEEIKTILENEGIDIRLNNECMSFSQEGENINVHLSCTGNEKSAVGSHLLLAIGRQPNTDDLGLEHAGVKINDNGYINVDDELKTTADNIWALGECNGQGAFTHTAYNDYEIVVHNLFSETKRSIKDRILAYALYIDPALGRVGMTEEQARQSGRNILFAKRPMTMIKRAVLKGYEKGFMKVMVDADTKEILGAAVLGPSGDEVIHSLIDMMYAKAPYTIITNAVHIHPTVSELIPTLLHDLK